VRLEKMMNVHDMIICELEQTKSLAALVYAVERGREVEFTANGTGYFLSRHKSQKAFSLWDSRSEQSFDSMEELIGNAEISGRPFLTAWKDAEITTIF